MEKFYKPPEPFGIFSEPFKLMDCEAAPEFIESWRKEDHGFHQKRITVRRLGETRGEKSFVFENGFDHLPDICLYRLSDVPMFHSLSFSKAGGVFWPSLRYRQIGDVTGFSLPRPINPRPLGNGYFAYLTKPHSSQVKYVEEPAMPFYTFPEYGHYLMESLPSLYFLKIKPELKLILPPETKSIPRWLNEMVAPFGLGEKSFIISDELTVFKDFYLPSRLYMEAQYLNSPTAGLYGHISRHYDGGRPGEGLEKIYISRRGVENRCLVNEADCEKIFQDKGFAVIRPECLAFSEQVRLFARATHVAGPVGTALHNGVFSLWPEKLKLMMMIPEGLLVAKNFYQIESAFGRVPSAVFGQYLDPEVPQDIRLTFYAPWILNLDKLALAIDEWLDEN